MRARDARAAVAQLRTLLAAIDAGEVDATDAERAHLAGALEALHRAAAASSVTRPPSRVG